MLSPTDLYKINNMMDTAQEFLSNINKDGKCFCGEPMAIRGIEYSMPNSSSWSRVYISCKSNTITNTKKGNGHISEIILFLN